MVILRTLNKITDFLMILAWASPFNKIPCGFEMGVPSWEGHVNKSVDVIGREGK